MVLTSGHRRAPRTADDHEVETIRSPGGHGSPLSPHARSRGDPVGASAPGGRRGALYKTRESASSPLDQPAGRGVPSGEPGALVASGRLCRPTAAELTGTEPER